MSKFGYLRDPLSTVGPDGKPLVGDRKVQLWGHSLNDNDFETFKSLAPLRLAGDVDLSEFSTESNQYDVGSCAGNATADSVEVLNAIQGLPRVQLSRLFVYSMARMLQDQDGDGKNDLNKDEGTFIRLCFDVLSRFGICREDDPVNGWPYIPANVFVSPSLRAQRQATGHRIHDYYRIRSEGDDRLNDIVLALRAQHPIVFGTTITEDFRKLRDASPIGPPKDGAPTLGGHAMMIIGYDAQKGFLIKNSWGKRWGQDGFCFMTPEYLTHKDTWDLWVPTLGVGFKESDPT